MKKLLKTLSVIICAILLTTSVVPNLPVNSVETVYAATKKPKLNYTKKTIYEGKTFTLKVSGTKNKVKWSTSNKKIATVNSKGVVKGIKEGNATITAKIDKKSLKCKVEVKSKVVNVEKIVLNKESIELKIGQSTKISATIKPSNATNKTLKWKSDNKNVAIVDNKGLVKGVSDGTAIITVSSANGIKEDCVIDVVKNDEQISEPSDETEEPSVIPSENPSTIEPSAPIEKPSEISSDNDLSIPSNNPSIEISVPSIEESVPSVEPSIVPSISEEPSSEPSLPSVEPSLPNIPIEPSVTPSSPVEPNVPSEEPSIIPSEPEITEIQLNYHELNGKIGDVWYLNVLSIPDKKPVFDIVYDVGSSDVVSIEENGTVTAKKSGMVTIVAKYKVGEQEFSDSCKITIKANEGVVSGNITYHYNQYRGYVPNTGSMMFLIPKDGSALDIEDELFKDYSYLSFRNMGSIGIDQLRKANVYAGKADGLGNFTISHVPEGEYFVYIISEETTTGMWFDADDKEVYYDRIKTSLGRYLDEDLAYLLSRAVCMNAYAYDNITVNADETTTLTHEFPYTYM